MTSNWRTALPAGLGRGGTTINRSDMVPVDYTNLRGSTYHYVMQLKDGIDAFVAGAEQFDDITMLCVRYSGSGVDDGKKYSVKCTVPADVDRLGEVNAFIEEELEKVECPRNEVFNLTLVVEEVFVNIAHYAYDGKAGDAEIGFAFEKETRTVEMRFSDHGIPFDPTSRPAPDTTLRPEQRRIGGLGIHLVKQLMDEVRYEYQGGMNRLTVRKRI